jgi:hypothetical protein
MRTTVSAVGRYVNWTRHIQLRGRSTSGEYATLPLRNTGIKMRSYVILGVFVSAAALSACSTVPSVTSEQTTMTKAEIAAEGLICRKDKPPDTNIPRTICASESAWAVFDEKRRRETEALLAEGRKNTNVGRFNRD